MFNAFYNRSEYRMDGKKILNLIPKIQICFLT